jgi:hypothetical protein
MNWTYSSNGRLIRSTPHPRTLRARDRRHARVRTASLCCLLRVTPLLALDHLLVRVPVVVRHLVQSRGLGIVALRVRVRDRELVMNVLVF